MNVNIGLEDATEAVIEDVQLFDYALFPEEIAAIPLLGGAGVGSPGSAGVSPAEESLTPLSDDGLVLLGDGDGPVVTTTIKYYYINGQRVAQAKDGVFTWIHADHLSSATRITDVNGLEIRRLAYAAFGEEAENTGTGDDPKYTYTGKERDATGLYYSGARYYDPALSRFITADTVYDTGPQGLNRYSYALNNPIIYRDPTGHQVLEGAAAGTAVCGPPCTVAGALIGLGLGLGIGAYIVHNLPVDDVEEGSDVIPLPQIPDDALPAEPDDEIPGEIDGEPPTKPEDPKGPGRRPPFPYSKKDSEWQRPKGWRLPKEGRWSGTPGDSTFYPDNPERYGLNPGQGISFKRGYPDLSPFSKGTFDVPGLTGNHADDMPKIHRYLAEEKGWLKADGTPNQGKAADWLSKEGLIPHHAGGTKVQLIPEEIHGNRRKGIPGISHMGGGHELRNQ